MAFGVFRWEPGPSTSQMILKKPQTGSHLCPLVGPESPRDGDEDGPERDGSWLVKKIGLCVLSIVWIFSFLLLGITINGIYIVLPFVTFLDV